MLPTQLRRDVREQLSTAPAKALRGHIYLGKSSGMDGSRIDQAVARLDVAMARISKARAAQSDKANDPANSARVMALVNSHEKLREEVADTIGELDALLEELEG